MKIFRCIVCGEAYIGSIKPSHCPFCGAHEPFLINATDWKEENIGVEISEKTKEYLEKSLNLELNNSAFYKCLSKTIEDPEISGMFKFLGKVEKEHASVVKKLLGLKEIEEITEKCTPNINKDLEESMSREDRAIHFYREIVRECPEPRIKKVFGAFVEIETDHFNLAKEKLEQRKIKE